MNMKRLAALVLALALCLLCACSSEKDDRIAELEKQLTEKEAAITELETQIADTATAAENDAADIEAQLAEKDTAIADLEAQIAEKDATIADLEKQLAATNYVAEFDGGYVTVEEAMAQYEYVEYMYSMYGYSMDGYEDYIKQDIATTMANDKIVIYMATRLGLDVISDEELATITANAEGSYNVYVETYRAEFEAEGKSEEDVIAETEAFLAENGVTLEGIIDEEKKYLIADKVYEYVVASVEVTEDDIVNAYNTYVADDMTTFADPYYYESAVMGGETIYWQPDGYRNVRQVLVAFDDDQSARYDEITDRIFDLETELADAPAEVPADEPGAETAAEADKVAAEETTEETTEEPTEETTEETTEEPTEEPTEETDEPDVRTAAVVQAELDAANAELDALFAELEPTANEVVEAFNNGTPIDELIATYGGDPGSINDDGTTNTYVVAADSMSYDAAFTAAAMSVEEIGGLSEPTRGMYGLYIVYYDSDVAAGEIGLENVKEDISATLIEDKRTAAYEAQLTAWGEELGLVFYMDNFR